MLINRKTDLQRIATGISFLVMILALIGGPVVVHSVSQEKRDLFVKQDENKADLTAGQAALLEKIKSDQTAADVRLVTVKTGLLTSAPVGIKLNVRSGKQFEPLSTEVRTSVGGFTWIGEAKAPSDDAVLVVRDGNVTGTIRTGNELYSIKPIGGGLHVIIRRAQNRFPPEHPPEFEQKQNDPVEKFQPSPVADILDSVRTLRILVAYTPRVAAAFSDIEGFINLAISETNLGYTNSKINLRAELAYAHQVDYTEAGNQDTDLNNFRTANDSIMDEVHQLRNTHRADVCVLIIDDASFCGTSKIMATQESAFAVVHYACATGYYSFAHEIGHLQGARHNKEADSATTPFSYGHGYYNVAGKWRTIMSYDCPQGGCVRLPYWSNPNIKYKDSVMGSLVEENNSRALNETAPVITSFTN